MTEQRKTNNSLAAPPLEVVPPTVVPPADDDGPSTAVVQSVDNNAKNEDCATQQKLAAAAAPDVDGQPETEEDTCLSAKLPGYEFTNPRPPFQDYPDFYFVQGLVVDSPEAQVTAADLVRVLNLHMEYTDNKSRYSEKDIIKYFVEVPSAPTTDSAVIISKDGDKKVLGFCQAEVNKRTGQCYASAKVDLHREDRVAIFSAAVDEAVAAIKSHIVDIEEGKPVTISCSVSAKLSDFTYVLELKGFSYVRSWLLMEISLDAQDFPDQCLPEGLILQPYSMKTQSRQLYEAEQEAFRDHSGHAEDYPYDKWLHWHVNDEKEELFFIAWDGDQIAGGVCCSDDSSYQAGLADIHTVFVRRPYRRRGLASTLLRTAFQSLKAKGFSVACLSVDGKSKTNAVSLYQRVGLSIKRELRSYRVLVQGNAEDVVD